MSKLILYFLLQFNCPIETDTLLIKSLIIRESNGFNNKVSVLGAIGLMQIKPIALEDFNKINNKNYSVEDLKIDNINIEVGIFHLCRWNYPLKNLLEIYFVGYSRWKVLREDLDHDLWEKINWYTKSIYYRKWILQSYKRIE